MSARLLARARQPRRNANLGGPFVEIAVVERTGADAQDAEDVTPLRGRNLASGHVPRELAEDGVLGTLGKQRLFVDRKIGSECRAERRNLMRGEVDHEVDV